MNYRLLLAAILTLSCSTAAPRVSEADAALGRELEAIAVSGNAAALIRAGTTDAAIRILEKDLLASLSRANEMAGNAASLRGGDYPSLRQAATRAAAYGRDTHNLQITEQATQLEKALSTQ